MPGKIESPRGFPKSIERKKSYRRGGGKSRNMGGVGRKTVGSSLCTLEAGNPERRSVGV